MVGLVGAGGALGSLIASALLDLPNVELRCLARPSSRDRLEPHAARGARIVEGSLDPGAEAALGRFCAGADALICAAQGGPEVIIDGQLRLLNAAAAAGVKRFIPSDFSFDFFNLAEGENVMSDQRRSFASAAEAQNSAVEVVHVLNGCFLDRRVLFGFLGVIDAETGTARFWGDGRQKMDFTTYADAARYVAAAATDPRPLPSRFNIAGDILDFHELVRAFEEGSGRRLAVERLGSLEDLDARIAELQRADPANVPAYLPLMYYRAMLNGKAKLGELVNDRYPHIRPTRAVEYFRENF
ncbi:MAG: NmrA family NAD(P)-binding protein [Pseudomonadota bacterium]